MAFAEDDIESSNIITNVGPSSKKPLFANKTSSVTKTVKPPISASIGA